jgi:alpha-tubulin suppressor-like RCC1 family protein
MLRSMCCFIRRFVRRTVPLALAISMWGLAATGAGSFALANVATEPVDSSAVVPAPRMLGGGSSSTCAVTAGGGVKCWGWNGEGQLGDGTTANRTTPAYVSGLTSGIVSVSVSNNSACALTVDGGVKCWGWNVYGQLGDGTTIDRHSPVDVVGLGSGVSQIHVGMFNACALTTVGGVKCWGENNAGQVGDGTTTERLTPTDVVGLTSGVADLSPSGGHAHNCVVTLAGGAKCWGWNHFGQLGDGTTTTRLTPVDVSGLTSGVAAIGMGTEENCALTTGGGLKCWGYNWAGSLGDGTTQQRHTPVDVSGLTSGVVAVSSGNDGHTCALTDVGGVKCWGYNHYGQVGDGTTVDRLTAVDVAGLASGVAQLASGYYTNCVTTNEAGVKCWGLNSSGQVGDETTVNRLTPVDVSGSFYRTECPTLIASAHTSFTMSDGYAVASVASFSPSAGYALEGSATLTCQSDGTWNGAVPTATALLPLFVIPGATSVLESDSRTTALAVPVSLTRPGVDTITVQWTTVQVPGDRPEQADPTADYTPTSGTVTFNPGETAKTVAIAVNGDTLVEPDEYIIVSFHDPINAAMGGFWGLGIGVITNDDHARVTPAASSILEGDSSTTILAVTVTLSNPSTQTVTVQWTTVQVPGDRPEQADPTADYTPTSGTVTFNPGETAKTVAIAVNGDTLVEPDEYVIVSFHDPINATMGGFWGLGIGVITNDD